MNPTLESMLAQSVLAMLLVAALVWTFVIAPRREPVVDTGGVTPAPSGLRAEDGTTVDPAVVEGHRELAPGERQGLVRSLERMEGDLAALRAEVERMRDQLRQEKSARS
jgi:hypothetical protein